MSPANHLWSFTSSFCSPAVKDTRRDSLPPPFHLMLSWWFFTTCDVHSVWFARPLAVKNDTLWAGRAPRPSNCRNENERRQACVCAFVSSCASKERSSWLCATRTYGSLLGRSVSSLIVYSVVLVCWLPLFFCGVFAVLWVEPLPLSAFPFPFLFALCPSCVCPVFLDCAGLPYYGRWMARVDLSLDPPCLSSGAEGGVFMEWTL